MVYHRPVFDIEQHKGLIVISPRGDAVGFREADLERDVDSVLSHADGIEHVGVIVDLGQSSYFGSVIIGAMTRIGQHVKQHDGEMVLCEASPEMLTTLKVMNLDSLFPYFDTRKVAVKALTARLKQ